MSGSPSDGCFSGCGGCLLVLVGVALFVAGPTGWVAAGVILVILFLLGAQGNRAPKAVRPPRRSTRERRGALEPSADPQMEAQEPLRVEPRPAGQQRLEPDPAPGAGLAAGLDPELDQLLQDARRSVDEAL